MAIIALYIHCICLSLLPKMSLDARAFADLQQGELGDVVASFVLGNTDYDSEDFSNYI